METTKKTVSKIFSENNPDKLQEFIGLFNPEKSDIKRFYKEISAKASAVEEIVYKNKIGTFNNLIINQDLNSVLKKAGKSFFVLHKLSPEIKILYRGCNDSDKCSSELHFKDNNLIMAGFSYPNLFNGMRQSFMQKLFGGSKKIITDFGSKLLTDKNGHGILIDDDTVLRIYYYDIKEINALLK